MSKIWKGLDTVMDALTTIGMIGIAVICIIQIIARFIFKRSIIWANEASCFLFVYVVFMGAFILIRDNGFIRMDLIQSKIPKAGRFVYDLVLQLLVVVYAAVFLIYGFQFAQRNGIQVSSAMHLPMNVVYSIMPISGFFMIVYSLRNIVAHIRSHINGTDTALDEAGQEGDKK